MDDLLVATGDKMIPIVAYLEPLDELLPPMDDLLVAMDDKKTPTDIGLEPTGDLLVPMDEPAIGKFDAPSALFLLPIYKE